MLFAILSVSAFRIALWSQDIITGIWNRHTPPFTTVDTENNSRPWPPTNAELDAARKQMWDFLGKGAIIFLGILFVLVLAENTAATTLYSLLSSSYLTAIGDSLNAGIGLLDFGGTLETLAPNMDQPQLVLYILFFGLPGAVMAIGARNFLFLMESGIRERIETVRDDGLIARETVFLGFLFLYSIGVCIQFVDKWL